MHTEAVTVAFRRRKRGVEAHADHVDDLCVLEHRHAGKADVRQEAANVCVDIILDQKLLGFAAGDVRFGFVVGNDDLDWPAVDAAAFIDAVDRHLQTDERGFPAKCSRA